MNKYSVMINGAAADHYDIEDAYRVGKVYQVGDSALEHARKKLKIPGDRGAKDRLQDMIEARDSLNRAIEQVQKSLPVDEGELIYATRFEDAARAGE